LFACVDRTFVNSSLRFGCVLADAGYGLSVRRRAHPSGHHQGAMDLRAGSPAAEKRTWSRSLRGPILAGPSPSCAYDNDHLRFPQIPPAKNTKAEKKEPPPGRRGRHSPPCARPSSNSSLDHRRSDARTAENGFAAKSSVNKSAKVVLGCIHLSRDA